MTAYAIFLAVCLIVLVFLLGWRAGRDHERHRPAFDADDTTWPWPRDDIRAAAARQRQQPRQL